MGLRSVSAKEGAYLIDGGCYVHHTADWRQRFPNWYGLAAGERAFEITVGGSSEIIKREDSRSTDADRRQLPRESAYPGSTSLLGMPGDLLWRVYMLNLSNAKD